LQKLDAVVGVDRIIAWTARRVGGVERARVILALACVLGLDGADKAAIGAMALPLEQQFGIGATGFGLILTCSVAVAAAATLPFGWLVDRVDRMHLLTWTVAVWAAAMLLSGLAPSYGFLLTCRLMLGGASAALGPAVASLVGDYFDPAERGVIYGHVLAGEIVGSGLGFALAGELASWTWRAGLLALVAPAGLLASGLRHLPEPRRGGGSRLHRRGADRKTSTGRGAGDQQLSQLISAQHVQPRRPLVLHEDPRRRSLWWALVYVLRIPTNRVLIISSALGYFYFTGLRSFGVEYVQRRFDLGHATAVMLVLTIGIGALAGVIVSGRLSDSLIRRGRLGARIDVAVVAYLASAALFVLGLLVTSAWIVVLVLAGGAAMLGATNPPLDAARLDIMPSGLWGRAEAVRTFLRKGAEALAPLTFGYLTEHVFAGHGAAGGMSDTLLSLIAALVAGGLVAIFARGSYPRDVATAEASERHASA
jgi:MFS family permease